MRLRTVASRARFADGTWVRRDAASLELVGTTPKCWILGSSWRAGQAASGSRGEQLAPAGPATKAVSRAMVIMLDPDVVWAIRGGVAGHIHATTEWHGLG